MRKVSGFFLAFAALLLSPPPLLSETLTESNWLDMTVGFKPDSSVLGGLKAGDIIDKSNMAKAKEAIPKPIQVLIEKYGLKLPLRDYAPILPSKNYISATNQYSGLVKLVDTGNDTKKNGIEGYVAGLPFPKPQNGTEVAWNYHYMYEGDNFHMDFKVFWVNPSRGVERSQVWEWFNVRRALNRTELEPKPAIPEFLSRNIRSSSLVNAKEPFDVSGLRQLYYNYNSPRDNTQWVYVPSLRRTIQLSYGQRGDAWNSTDLLIEDVRGYDGFIEWQDWKLIGKKTMLGSFHTDLPNTPDGYKGIMDLENPPYVNLTVNWEPRPVYVVEATSKFTHYPYSRMVFYVDAETFRIIAKEGYDRKGDLWRTLVQVFNEREKGQPVDFRIEHTVDHKINHATLFYGWNWRYNNPSFKPSDFTLSALRSKTGRGN